LAPSWTRWPRSNPGRNGPPGKPVTALRENHVLFQELLDRFIQVLDRRCLAESCPSPTGGKYAARPGAGADATISSDWLGHRHILSMEEGDVLDFIGEEERGALPVERSSLRSGPNSVRVAPELMRVGGGSEQLNAIQANSGLKETDSLPAPENSVPPALPPMMTIFSRSTRPRWPEFPLTAP
jgi:hypothetical protein